MTIEKVQNGYIVAVGKGGFEKLMCKSFEELINLLATLFEKGTAKNAKKET